MARGHWRNWDELSCPNCPFRSYKKYSKNYLEGGIYKCPKCGTELEEVSLLSSND